MLPRMRICSIPVPLGWLRTVRPDKYDYGVRLEDRHLGLCIEVWNSKSQAENRITALAMLAEAAQRDQHLRTAGQSASIGRIMPVGEGEGHPHAAA